MKCYMISYPIRIKSLKLILYLLFTFCFTSAYTQFQSPSITKTDSIGYVYITGRVDKNRKPLENASIIIYDGNNKITNLRTPSNGKFSFKLEFEKSFNVEITKAGMVIKKFAFDTKLPEDVSKKVVFTFDFAVALFPKYDYIDMSILEKPLAIIMYQKKYDAFFYEYNYAKSINEKVIDLENKIEELIREYDINVEVGRKFFELEKYRESLTKFERAHDIFPDEPYPIEKIALINSILNQDKNKKELYTQLVAQAEDNVRNKEYENAIDLLGQAIQIMPTEKYPAERIMEIKKIIGKLKIKEDNYNLAISKGDNSFGSKMYTEAETYYIEASSLFPDRAYPKDKIAEIYKLQSEISKEVLYNSSIKEGDQLYNNSQYLNAISAYKKALSYKPEEQFPKDRINLINKKLKELEYSENAYKQTIVQADKYMAEKENENAKNEYIKASKIKPEEQYPKDRIREISRILDEMKSKEELYENAIAAADECLDVMDYNGAIVHYKQALEYKPYEKYPEIQISRINYLKIQKAKQEEQYLKIIYVADKLSEDKDFSRAKITYKDALEIKPNENYPKEKINAIDKMLAEQKDKIKEYGNVIEQADESLDMMDFSKAKSLYIHASELAPEDKLSKNKIEVLNKILQATETFEESYSRMIVTADIAISVRDYNKAKDFYLKASEIKPEEKYPKDKLKEIDNIFKSFESNRLLYNSLILEADDLYNLKKFKDARDIYIKASKLNPIQKYPKQRIDEINKLLISSEYDKAIDEVNNELIEKLKEKKFSFSPIRDKGKTNYILIEATNLNQNPYKVLVFYGKNEERTGGFELDFKKQKTPVKYIVRVGNQENWSNLLNNWISIQPIGGDIEVNNIKIYKGK